MSTVVEIKDCPGCGHRHLIPSAGLKLVEGHLFALCPDTLQEYLVRQPVTYLRDPDLTLMPSYHRVPVQTGRTEGLK